jgi:hypothetical protein
MAPFGTLRALRQQSTHRGQPLTTDRERDQRRRQRLTAYRRDVAPLIHAFSQAGIDPTDFGRFVNRVVPGVVKPSTFDETRAAPILLDWLPRIINEHVKESIVRHLRTKAVKGIATPTLITEFTNSSSWLYKWVVGDVLGYVATRTQFPELVALAADPRHGRGREMLVGMLWRVKTPEADATILAFLADPDVARAAMSALRRRLGNLEARPHVAPLAAHEHEHVRTAARNHLRTIDRLLARKS